MKIKLEMNFENQEALTHFKHWLCGSGEQGYWDWMAYREDEEPGDITITQFDYNNGNIMNNECGRIGDE